ncbi:hypothetical protein AURDEDRAFT_110030 [Auricularia subglabra TFB-10046 SS5]|nr:hypothetical protein AURDEDRAFT_110030 [Auricularia subglabra TFB-10046 SS5]
MAGTMRSTLLTPPCSDTESEFGPLTGGANWTSQLPVSETFNQAMGSPDLILVSFDTVLFFVNSAVLLSASRNCFNGLPAAAGNSRALRLTGQALPAVCVPEDEAVLAIVLRAIYGLSLADRTTDIARLESAMDSLINRYAVHIPPLLSPGCIIFGAIVDLAQQRPLDAYILAAYFNLEQLAVMCSAQLVSFPLWDVTDDHARKMGPLFLCRLFNLHISRVTTLRRLLANPPALHEPSAVCSQTRLNDLENAWLMAAAAILCEANADVLSSKLESILLPLLARLCCTVCYQALSKRIADLVSQWSAVKATI